MKCIEATTYAQHRGRLIELLAQVYKGMALAEDRPFNIEEGSSRGLVFGSLGWSQSQGQSGEGLWECTMEGGGELRGYEGW